MIILHTKPTVTTQLYPLSFQIEGAPLPWKAYRHHSANLKLHNALDMTVYFHMFLHVFAKLHQNRNRKVDHQKPYKRASAPQMARAPLPRSQAPLPRTIWGEPFNLWYLTANPKTESKPNDGNPKPCIPMQTSFKINHESEHVLVLDAMDVAARALCMMARPFHTVARPFRTHLFSTPLSHETQGKQN